MHLSDEEFADLVDQALDSLPESFRPHMENVIVEIHPRPSREILARLKIPRGGGLLGYYQGVPMTQKSVSAPPSYPERILIFQLNIEAVCHDEE